MEFFNSLSQFRTSSGGYNDNQRRAQNYDVYADWITPAGIRPPQSLLGINRLVLPELLVEIEATAAI